MNVEIRNHFYFEKRNSVRRKIVPGNSKSLWNAVKASKDLGASALPVSMTLGGEKISEHERSNCFATHFEEKIRLITNSTVIDPNVYNGIRKMVASNEIFMSITNVEQCIKNNPAVVA